MTSTDLAQLTRSPRTGLPASTSTQTRHAPTPSPSGAARLVRAVSRLWRSISRWFATVFQAVTRVVQPAGVLVICTASIGLGVGLVFGWMEWIVAGAIALLLLLMSIPFVFGGRSYVVGLWLERERIVAGDGVDADIVVRNDGKRTVLPGRIDIPVGQGLVEFGVPVLRPGRVLAQTLELPPQRRGVVRVGPATAVRSDPIGLLRREYAFPDVYELYVHPATTSLPPTSAGLVRDLDGNPTRRLVDADTSFHAIREYVPGDARRQIHWKSTAKTGRLMVRQFEESRRARIAVFLGGAEEEYVDADEYELAVSAAASLGARAVRDARDLVVAVGTSARRTDNSRSRGLRRLDTSSPRVLLDDFCRVERDEDAAPFEQACRSVSNVGDQLSVAIIVTGSTVTLTRIRRAALAFDSDTLVVAVRCDERARPRIQPTDGVLVLTIGTIDDLAGLMLRGATG